MSTSRSSRVRLQPGQGSSPPRTRSANARDASSDSSKYGETGGGRPAERAPTEIRPSPGDQPVEGRVAALPDEVVDRPLRSGHIARRPEHGAAAGRRLCSNVATRARPQLQWARRWQPRRPRIGRHAARERVGISRRRIPIKCPVMWATRAMRPIMPSNSTATARLRSSGGTHGRSRPGRRRRALINVDAASTR